MTFNLVETKLDKANTAVADIKYLALSPHKVDASVAGVRWLCIGKFLVF